MEWVTEWGLYKWVDDDVDEDEYDHDDDFDCDWLGGWSCLHLMFDSTELCADKKKKKKSNYN